MARIRTLIVDDEALARQRIRHLLKDIPDVEVIGDVGSATEAVAAIQASAPDLVFLDVEMPVMSGLDVVRAIDDVATMPAIVFITAHEQFAARAFEIPALDYVLKPFGADRVAGAVDRARRSLARQATAAQPLLRMLVKDEERTVVVQTADIHWIAAAGNYVELHTGKKTYLLRKSLAEKCLPVEQFFQALCRFAQQVRRRPAVQSHVIPFR